MYHQLIEEPELVTTKKSKQRLVPKNIKNGISTRMQFDDISIDADNESKLKNGASEIVSRLRPEWGTRNHFQFKIFSDGITNKLVGVFVEGRAIKAAVLFLPNPILCNIDKFIFHLTKCNLLFQEEKKK